MMDKFRSRFYRTIIIFSLVIGVALLGAPSLNISFRVRIEQGVRNFYRRDADQNKVVWPSNPPSAKNLHTTLPLTKSLPILPQNLEETKLGLTRQYPQKQAPKGRVRRSDIGDPHFTHNKEYAIESVTQFYAAESSTSSSDILLATTAEAVTREYPQKKAPQERVRRGNIDREPRPPKITTKPPITMQNFL